MKIETRNPSALTPHPHNSRKHSPEQIEQLRRSIREFGFTRPVVINGNGVILAGHGAVQAAVLEGLSEIPVAVAAHLSDRQQRAYVIADNKLSMNSTWDFAVLGNELSYLSEVDFDLDVLGFNEQELDALLKDDEGILPPGFDGRMNTPTSAVADSRAIPSESDDELVPLGSGVSRTHAVIPKVTFSKYVIPLTAAECERLEREINSHLNETGSLAGFFARLWADRDGAD